jgi:uncharacterized membrane protein YeiH
MWPAPVVSVSTLVLVLDLCGAFVFALSGAMAGIKHKLDLFGVMVLSFAAATLGGIMRDVVIGAVPPPGISDWRYVAVSIAAGMATIYCHPLVDRVRSSVLIFDAAGLALFAVSGAQKAIDFRLGPITAMLLGMLTGIGGGMVRDVLAGEVPSVLRGDIYAVAALAGAGVVVIGRAFHFPAIPAAIAGAVLCFALRLIAIRRGWQLPGAQTRQPRTET